MMASLTVAISYYQLGKAPPQEPISGLFSQSWIETAFLSVVWGLTSLGALLLPAAVGTWNPKPRYRQAHLVLPAPAERSVGPRLAV